MMVDRLVPSYKRLQADNKVVETRDINLRKENKILSEKFRGKITCGVSGDGEASQGK